MPHFAPAQEDIRAPRSSAQACSPSGATSRLLKLGASAAPFFGASSEFRADGSPRPWVLRLRAARPAAGGSPALFAVSSSQCRFLRLRTDAAGWQEKTQLHAWSALAHHLAQRSHKAVQYEVRPNPSVERTSTGMALGPRSASGYRSASRAKHHAGSGPLTSNVRPHVNP